MKNTLKYIATIISVIVITGSYAQQTRLTNLYGQNKYSFNPAYAGESGCTEIYFSHMNQWTRVEGAPVTNYLSANTRIGKSLGLGGNVLIDRLGMLQNVSASGSVSYGITIAKQHKIRLGVSGGYFQTRIDPTNAIAIDANDVIVQGGIQSSSTYTTEAGILYKFKGLELSFASQQLIESRTNAAYPTLEGYGLKRHFVAYGGYEIILNKRLSLTPSIFYKGIKNNSQLDFNLDLNYNDFIYGGLGYRMDVGLIGRIGINIRKLFYIGYAYEVPMQNIASYSGGSHEITLGLKFCKKPKKELPLEENVVEEKNTAVDPISRTVDTVTVVERIVDTVLIERIDTVFIDNSKPSNAEVKKALFNAEDHLEFENDKSIILKKSYGDLEALTNMLLIREELKITLEGHTDSNGTEAYNMRLSESRVKAVKKFLVANGVGASRISTNYFGESKPIADNKTEEGRAKNRRVNMKVVGE
ncbi:MAG: PorP/SprF family type IX secretion system membrane protein [Fluviicola sp.]|nr:PorP/SprF family type IX secretion system membrane protein [Fluviicola sp.]